MLQRNANNLFEELITTLDEGRKNSFETETMSRRERVLKKNLIKLLRDDGQGHHHGLYADRLEPFIVRIVPLNDKSISTCAISFDEGTIYINEGFLVDPKEHPEIFNQLSMLMRHELLHNLLMHQIRMMKHVVELDGTKLSMSSTFHDMLNILEDFEISNRGYTDADKETVRHTWLNGRLISGLVTEDHRAAWGGSKALGKNGMTVEEMYDALMKEIHDCEDGLLKDRSSDALTAAAARVTQYKRTAKTNSDYDSVDELFADILASWKRADPENADSIRIPQDWLVLAKGLKWTVDDPNNGYSEADFRQMLDAIAKSSPEKPVEIVSPVTGELLGTVDTPEDKMIAAEILQILSGHTAYPVDFKKWHNEVLNKVDTTEFTDDDIRALLDCVK